LTTFLNRRLRFGNPKPKPDKPLNRRTLCDLETPGSHLKLDSEKNHIDMATPEEAETMRTQIAQLLERNEALQASVETI
jgi:hypothetical protein